MKILMHCFHLGLLGVVESTAVRIAQIREYKPLEEHALRLRLLQEVPPSMLPIRVVRAAKLMHTAENRVSKAEEMLNLALGSDQIAARKAELQAALQVFEEAFNAFNKACNNSSLRLEALHKRLCVTDCPWDGEKILSYNDC